VARELTREIEATDAPTESELEDEMFRVIGEAELPEPRRQFLIYRYGIPISRADGAYPELRIALEADGYEWHSAMPEWFRDRRKQNLLIAMGLGDSPFHLGGRPATCYVPRLSEGDSG
jgi:hypothetical protein